MKKVLLLLTVVLVAIILVIGWLVFKKEGGEEEKVKIKMEKSKILMVLAPKDFRDEEYQAPRKILEEAGAVVTVSSKGVEEAKGAYGTTTTVDKDIGEVQVSDYDAIVFIGGPGTTVYFNDQQVLSLAKSAYESGKVIGAICIAPSILANSGILSGKNATSFSSEEANLRAKGANYTGEAVTVDGKIITAQGPEVAEEFGKKLVEVLQ